VADFEPPRLVAPRLADILGREAPDLKLVRMERRRTTTAAPVDPAELSHAAIAPHLGAVAAGDTVAIGVGSRGINGIDRVVAGIVSAVRERGAEPFIVPAMGSHGGADAPGQEQTLARLGVDAGLGASVRATMDTVDLGRAGDVSVSFDAFAAEADHILVVNRLKSHTSFSGRIESGLAKMLAIGLGKQHGAEELHRLGPARIEDRIVTAARHICSQVPVLGGIALVEGRDKTLAAVEFVAAEGIGGSREEQLLELAKSHEARLPVTQLDVLVVDVMGKEFSGTGMDTNVLGRRMVRSMPELETPHVTNVVCLEISEKSGGNAVGVGLADFVPRRLLERFDPVSTYANTLTAGSQGVQRAQIPIVLEDDVDAVSAAILTCEAPVLGQVRLVRVRNTLHLDDLLVSESLVAEVEAVGYDVTATSRLFGASGRLTAW
jgi:hypothetical protein